jgi:diguanylate cyclase
MTYKELLRVLFVEDSEDDIELMLVTLHHAYSKVLHHRVDTEGALRAALMHEKWDVVICDHNLPDLDAHAALRITQEENKGTPFIIVSGSIEEAAVVAAMTAGAADSVSKSNLARLVPTVEREMKKSSTEHDLKLAHAQINRISYYDQLTSLPNREFLQHKVNQLLDRAAGQKRFALLVVNINRFLQIPRTLGMDAANQAVRLVGMRIRDSIGDAGFVACLGGDRFAVLLYGCAHYEALQYQICRINEKSTEALNINGQELFLSCSVGVSVYPEDGRDFPELFINAETAMSLARTDSHGYRFFNRSMNASGQEQLELEHALYRAVKQEEFLLHYQPQFDLRSGRMIGVEALLRWQPSGKELISPARFIPMLEETGLIVQVGEWVLKKACEQNKAWQQAGLAPMTVAVNLSAIQFHQADLVPLVRRVLAETGLEPRYLELEITENIAMHREEVIISTLTELCAMGVGLAIDDFGTGYSSLSYLKLFPVHKLKIDRSFVIDIDDSENGGSLVRAIAALALNLGLKVIAEGVETAAQSDFLFHCGCEEVQGFLYSRPLAAEEIAGQTGIQGLGNPSPDGHCRINCKNARFRQVNVPLLESSAGNQSVANSL